jgi:sigma-B regulation protein RsbU (phosphoserine phosphatase)
MNNINRSIHRVTADDRFATLFIGVYDDESCLLTYVNAGHDPPVIFRPSTAAFGDRDRKVPADATPADGDPCTPAPIEAVKLENGGLLLGVDPNFDYRTSSHALRDGDVILCDTDGMKEAMDKQGQMYGADRLTHVVASHYGDPAEMIIDRIFQDVEIFVGGNPQADDMTLVVGKLSTLPAQS